MAIVVLVVHSKLPRSSFLLLTTRWPRISLLYLRREYMPGGLPPLDTPPELLAPMADHEETLRQVLSRDENEPEDES